MKRKNFTHYLSKVSNSLEEAETDDTKDLSRLATLAAEACKKPFLKNSELVIPHGCADIYRWWSGGQSILDTLLELNAPDEVIQKYIGPILTARSWERWHQEKTTEP